MRLRTAILSVIPGAAHVDLGWTWRGLLFFFLFALFLNGALIAPLLSMERGLRWGCLLAAAGLWLAALGDARRTARRSPPPPEGPS